MTRGHGNNHAPWAVETVKNVRDEPRPSRLCPDTGRQTRQPLLALRGQAFPEPFLGLLGKGGREDLGIERLQFLQNVVPFGFLDQ